MEFLIFALVFGLIPAAIAKAKGRSFGLWYLYGVLLGIVALIHSLVMKTNLKGVEQHQLSEGMQKCPHCAEFIKPDAKVRRYCSRDLPASDLTSHLQRTG